VAGVLLCFIPRGSTAQDEHIELAPPEALEAFDMPNDDGGEIGLTWKAMPYDGADVTYAILAAEQETGPFEEVARVPSNTSYKSDQPWPFWAWESSKDVHFVRVTDYVKEGKPAALKSGVRYWAKVVALRDALAAESVAVSAVPRNDLFNWLKLNNFIYMLLLSAIVLGYIARARRRELFLRKIPALDAVDEAVGRATEMGKPVYYLTGRSGMASVSTIAATTILGEIAKKVAAYDTRLKVPHTDPIVMAVSQEITKEAYIEAGRPDAYQEDSNFYVTDDQFGYTAAVDGMMVREKPGACFFMGYYYAESLLLAEVGASVKAIQIAGTDAEHQLPFFVTACDYTLIGEELYAASAYLSKNPVLVGTLRGQDTGKALLMAFLVAGVALATLGILFGAEEAVAYVLQVFADF
jgi:hypothetical protein